MRPRERAELGLLVILTLAVTGWIISTTGTENESVLVIAPIPFLTVWWWDFVRRIIVKDTSRPYMLDPNPTDSRNTTEWVGQVDTWRGIHIRYEYQADEDLEDSYTVGRQSLQVRILSADITIKSGVKVDMMPALEKHMEAVRIIIYTQHNQQ